MISMYSSPALTLSNNGYSSERWVLVAFASLEGSSQLGCRIAIGVAWMAGYMYMKRSIVCFNLAPSSILHHVRLQ